MPKCHRRSHRPDRMDAGDFAVDGVPGSTRRPSRRGGCRDGYDTFRAAEERARDDTQDLACHPPGDTDSRWFGTRHQDVCLCSAAPVKLVETDRSMPERVEVASQYPVGDFSASPPSDLAMAVFGGRRDSPGRSRTRALTRRRGAVSGFIEVILGDCARARRQDDHPRNGSELPIAWTGPLDPRGWQARPAQRSLRWPDGRGDR